MAKSTPPEKSNHYYKRTGTVAKTLYLDKSRKEKLYSLSDDIARRPSWVVYQLIDMLLEGQITIEEVEKFGLRRKKRKDPPS